MATVDTYDKYGKVNGKQEVGAVGTPGNPYQDMGEKIGTGGYPSGVKSSGGSSGNTATPPQYNITAQMESLKKAQMSQAMAGLDKSRNASLSNLSAERAVIEPQYQKQKMAANVTAKQTARSFDEYMAQRGGNQSGIAGQGQLMNNMAYQGQKGALDQGEAAAISDNARRVSDVGNAYESDLVGAKAGIEAQYLQNYIQQMNADRGFGLQQQQMNNQVDQFGQSMGLQRDQYQSGLNQWDKSFGLQQDQYNSGLSQWDKSFGLQKDQFGLQKDQFGLQKDQYSDSKTQQQWENEFRMMGFTADQAYQQAQLALARQSASRASSSGPSLSETKYQNEQNSKNVLSQVTSGIYDKVYGQNSSSQAALKTLTSNKGAIMSDLSMAGMNAKDALEYYQNMHYDLNKTINPKYNPDY